MIFNSTNGQFFSFEVVGYQYPNINDGGYDANWLLIKIIVKTKDRSWQSTDPALLTNEVQEIIDWLKQLSLSNKVSKSLDFIEPCIEFNLLKQNIGHKTIRISFDLEFLPDDADDENDYFIDCVLSNEELRDISLQLEKELSVYPER